jgi:bacterioferritin (cytochrome b1)
MKTEDLNLETAAEELLEKFNADMLKADALVVRILEMAKEENLSPGALTIAAGRLAGGIFAGVEDLRIRAMAVHSHMQAIAALCGIDVEAEITIETVQ